MSKGGSDWRNGYGKEPQVLTQRGTEGGPGPGGKKGWGRALTGGNNQGNGAD